MLLPDSQTSRTPVSQPTLPLEALPPLLRPGMEACWHEFRSAEPELAQRLLAVPEVADSLARVWACSEFVARSCRRQPELAAELVAGANLRSATPDTDTALQVADSEPEMLARLRRHRLGSMLQIAWRDLAGWASLEETLDELSDLADRSIVAALAFARRALHERMGVPRGEDGTEQHLLVLGMGKLGGRELNFSSDIDLVFLYPQAGSTDGPKCADNETYFTRLGQKLIGLLDTATADGTVFRVDMRLRPFGDSGPLVTSFAAFEAYLQQHGREWERYAYVKARPITAPAVATDLQAQVLRPFVYRRYLDYGVFESLREMKDLIAREVERRDLEDNIKLGPGGIREIEFVVQALQLIRGGRTPELQARELLRVLPRLQQHRLLSEAAVAELSRAYMFLRRLENRLQAWDDRQTHELPSDEVGRARLALAMGYPDWEALGGALARHRANVSGHFESIVFGPRGRTGEAADDELMGVWERSRDEARANEALRQAGIHSPGPVRALLARLRSGSLYLRLDETGRRRLDALVPRLLRAVSRVAVPVQPVALQRLVTVLEAVGRRTAYLALLNENPGALQHLTHLCALSEFLTRQVAAHPLLLDELLDPRIFEAAPSREQFAGELAARRAAAREDPEQVLEALRQFQQAATFRVAVSDLNGVVPLMRVSDLLTDIAELALQQALDLAWEHLTARHGNPRCSEVEGAQHGPGFAIVAYGKLGGIELGYGSDLDLVFVHDSEGAIQRTDGERSLDNQVFFARLGRRIVHILTTQTPSGALYEVDMRLRPSGRSGLLVTGLQAFEQYQSTEAWTWEHQALLRARAVAGTPAVREAFRAIRRRILRQAVNRDTLLDDVRRMRERMRRELPRGGAELFDVKQDRGGIADIEFLVQYWVLRNARDEPSLTRFSDNMRQLEALADNGLVPLETTRDLGRIYRAYRRCLHRLSLGEGSTVVDAAEFETQRAVVGRVWGSVFGP